MPNSSLIADTVYSTKIFGGFLVTFKCCNSTAWNQHVISRYTAFKTSAVHLLNTEQLICDLYE